MNIGQRYFKDWSLINDNGSDYYVLNPRQLLLDLIKYEKEPNEWDLKKILLVGMQNSGKSNFIRYFCSLVSSVPDYVEDDKLLMIKTNDLRIVGDKRYAHLFDGKRIIVLIIDDAIRTGFDSRSSMSGANVEITQQFAITRHLLEENYAKSGIIFMLFAVQSLTRLDKTIRDECQLCLFMNYYDKDWFKKIFAEDDVELLRNSTYDSMFASDFDKRKYCLAKTMTGDVATLNIPYVPKGQVNIIEIDRSIDKDDAIAKLTTQLLENDTLHRGGRLLSDYKMSHLKGFLWENKGTLEKDYNINLRDGDYLKAINLALYKEEIENDSDYEESDVVDLNNDSLKDNMYFFLKKKRIMSVDELEHMIGGKRGSIIATIGQYPDMFKSVRKGWYALVENEFTEEEIIAYTNIEPKKPMKKLIME